MAKNKDFSTTKAEVLRLSGGKRERAERLLEKAEFMDQELRDLQKIIREKGWTEEYQNGENQRGIKRSSEGDVYMTLMKNYVAVMKALSDMLENVPDASDELEGRFFK